AAVLPLEDRAEYERLWAGLVESLQPVGTLEALLVEDIAAIYWRRRRAVRAEAAILELDMTRVRNKVQSTMAEIQSAEAARSIGELCRSATGLRRLSEVFDAMAREIRLDGKLSEESIAWLEADWKDEELDALRGATTVTDAAKKEAREFLLGFIADMQKMFRRQ